MCTKTGGREEVMQYCHYCGAILEDHVMQCPICGETVAVPVTPAPEPVHPGPVSIEPAYTIPLAQKTETPGKKARAGKKARTEKKVRTEDKKTKKRFEKYMLIPVPKFICIKKLTIINIATIIAIK